MKIPEDGEDIKEFVEYLIKNGCIEIVTEEVSTDGKIYIKFDNKGWKIIKGDKND